jgi:hypothetical protein
VGADHSAAATVNGLLARSDARPSKTKTARRVLRRARTRDGGPWDRALVDIADTSLADEGQPYGIPSPPGTTRTASSRDALDRALTGGAMARRRVTKRSIDVTPDLSRVAGTLRSETEQARRDR